jgi:hypothetical protein
MGQALPSRIRRNLIFTEPQSGNIVPDVVYSVLAKHSKSFSLIDCISVGVDRMHRNFEPMGKQVVASQRGVGDDPHFAGGAGPIVRMVTGPSLSSTIL